MQATTSPAIANERLLSLDTLRGLTMLLLLPDVFGGFSFYKMAEQFPDSALWAALAGAFTHAEWRGMTLWDMVMPLFVFMVGVSMPYSYAARSARGDTRGRQYRHALERSIVLLMLGMLLLLKPLRTLYDFMAPLLLLSTGLALDTLLKHWLPNLPVAQRQRIDSAWQVWRLGVIVLVGVRLLIDFPRIGNPWFHDVLPQIALGYVLVYLLIGRAKAWQHGALGAILVGYWLAFALYPVPDDQVYSGFFAHWNKNTNLAADFDVWFLNLLPRTEPFLYNSHGYQTLNFIPTMGTMLLGLMTGEYLRSGRARQDLGRGLWLGGAALVVTGLIAGLWICPIVKSIWTPSWVLLSGGMCLLALAGLYQLVDVRGTKSWTAPLVIAGRNPLLLYTLAYLYRWWLLKPWHILLGPAVFQLPAAPLIEAALVAVTLWLGAAVLDRLRIYVRL